jgi:Superinfection immunity protein
VRALADSGVLRVLVFTVLLVLYLLPTLIGAIRRVDGLALVFLVSLIGAPTGVGWLGAMIMAFGPRRVLARRWCRGRRTPSGRLVPSGRPLPMGVQNVVHSRVSPVRSERSLTWSWSQAAGSR